MYDFGRALRFLKVGYRVRRRDWDGAWIELPQPMGSIILHVGVGCTVTWRVFQEDVLACDWEIAGNVD